jgi:hypothetical protein
LPKTDADVWLASAFAKYERVVALEKSLLKHSTDHKLSAAEEEKVAVALFAHRAEYELGVRAFEDVPLSKIVSDTKLVATVPKRAKSGPIVVTSALKQVRSKGSFRVLR